MSDNDFLRRHTPDHWIEVSPAVRSARSAVSEAGRELATIADEAIEKPWTWRERDSDVRHGLFEAIHHLEAAAGSVAATLAGTGATRSAAAQLIALGTFPRWALHGRLAGVRDDQLDVVAKDGEWTVRETLAHIVGSQRGYATFTAWYWKRNRAVPPTEEEIAALEADSQLPEESTEAVGTLDDIRARLDETTDLTGTLAEIPDADLGQWARYSGVPVDIGYRLGRPSPHLMEHAIQLDKTLGWLDHRPTEAQRIVRDMFETWGRLETLIWPMEPAALAARDGSGRSVEAILAQLGGDLVKDARTTRAASEASASSTE